MSRKTRPDPELIKYAALPAAIAVITAFLMLGGQTVTAALRYQHDAILHGQWWRLLSGNFVHLGWPHLGMNLAGLILIWMLFGRLLSTAKWLVILFFSSLGVGLGLLTFDPELVWYVGLSGTLHGLFVAGAIASLRAGYRLEWLLLLFLAGKLAWEHFNGAMPGSASLAGGTVIVDAHLYGAISGLIVIGAMTLYTRFRSRS